MTRFIIQTTIYDDTILKQPDEPPPRQFIRGVERRNEPQEGACTDSRAHLDPVTGRLGCNFKDEAGSRAQ
jgi:hypothetical protein